MSEVTSQQLVFVGGLHRSGTTALGRILADHPEFSGLTGTGVEEDEGQHLQGTYSAASRHGGPGRFAFRREAGVGPVSPAVALEHRRQLLGSWNPYWDPTASYLVEKSPPNMLMGRYLQSVFPGSALLVIVRHPVVVALSTKKWRRASTLTRLVQHWFRAHDRLLADASALDRLLIVRYEDLVTAPEPTLRTIKNFVGVTTPFRGDRVETSRSRRYEEAWALLSEGTWWERHERRRIIRRFAERAEPFGYDIGTLATHTEWSIGVRG